MVMRNNRIRCNEMSPAEIALVDRSRDDVSGEGRRRGAPRRRRRHPDRYYAAHAIILAGLALFLPAILGLMYLLSHRATAFGHVGGGLAMIGLFGATAVVAVDGIAVSQMGQPQASAEEMAALLDRIRASAGFQTLCVAQGLPDSFWRGVDVYGLADVTDRCAEARRA